MNFKIIVDFINENQGTMCFCICLIFAAYAVVCKMRKSNNVLAVIELIVACIALAFGSMALCKDFPRTNLGFDYIGAIFGALAVLVALVLGWQIYNALEVHKDLIQVEERMRKAEDDLKNKWQEDIASIVPLFIYLKENNYEHIVSEGIKIFIDNKDTDNIARRTSIEFIKTGIVKILEIDSGGGRYDMLIGHLGTNICEADIKNLIKNSKTFMSYFGDVFDDFKRVLSDTIERQKSWRREDGE